MKRGNRRAVLHSGDMHTYRLFREGGSVRIFVDGNPIERTLSANLRNELRDFMGLHGLLPSDIDFKVHELYLTNATCFTSVRDGSWRSH